jgi:hypothetical protein
VRHLRKLISVNYFLFFFLIYTPLAAEGLICYERNVGGTLNAFSSRKAAESWYPPYVSVTNNEVKFGTSRNSWYKASRNRGSSYENAKGSFGGQSYNIQYRRNTNSMSVLMVAGSRYKSTAPVIYRTCNKISVSASLGISDYSQGKKVFASLSNCNKRYLQQFLKGQGAYSGAIDGIWGNGTARALEKIKNTGNLKGKSVNQIIETLTKNPVCS